MFGIGLPELFVIFVVALIVVGPDKLPGLARSLAKGLVDIRKTLDQAKESLSQENEMLESVKKDLKDASESMRDKMIEADPANWRPAGEPYQKQTEDVIDVMDDSPGEQNPQQGQLQAGANAAARPEEERSEEALAPAAPVTEHPTTDDGAGQASGRSSHD